MQSMFVFIKRYMRRCRSFLKRQKPRCFSLFMVFCRILPVQNKAVFISYKGKYYNCNPRAIYEEIHRRMPKCKYIWLMNDDTIVIEGAKVVKNLTFKAAYHLATARLWIDNCRKPYWVRKRPQKQYYVNVSHGGIAALKKLERDVEDKISPVYVRNAKHDSKCADLFLSASKWRSEKFRTIYWYDGEILEYGVPRSDVFFQDGSKIKENVQKYFNLSSDDRIAVYAPTFRNSGTLGVYLSQNECYELLSSLKENWGGEWKLVVRLHPHISDKNSLIQYDNQILNGSVYDNLSDLIIASDLLITDYSGCMFDGMEAKKPVFLFASDVDEYMDERGFYLKFEEMPFPFATNIGELITWIERFNPTEYAKKSEEFRENVGSFNNAHASERVVDYIIDHYFS